VSLVEHDHLIQQFSAATTHPTFGNPVLPRTPIGRSNRLAAHGFDHFRDFFIILSISMQDEVARCGVFGKGLSQLLHDLLAGRVLSDVEVEDSPPAVADHEEAVKHTESCRRHREQIHRCNHFPMVFQKD
jgi:hypothetical protein